MSTAENDILDVFYQELRDHEVIWKPQHESHKKYAVVSSAWKDILKTLFQNFTREELQESRMESIEQIKLRYKVKKDTRRKQRMILKAQRRTGGKSTRVKLDPRLDFLDDMKLFRHDGLAPHPSSSMHWAPASPQTYPDSGQTVETLGVEADVDVDVDVDEQDGLAGEELAAIVKLESHAMEDAEADFGLDRQEGELLNASVEGASRSNIASTAGLAPKSKSAQSKGEDEKDEVDYLFSYFKTKFRKLDKTGQNRIQDIITAGFREVE